MNSVYAVVIALSTLIVLAIYFFAAKKDAKQSMDRLREHNRIKSQAKKVKVSHTVGLDDD